MLAVDSPKDSYRWTPLAPSILPKDEGLSKNALNEVFAGTELPASLSFLGSDKDYLGYVMPPDYVM
jgi:hypothetical protein